MRIETVASPQPDLRARLFRQLDAGARPHGGLSPLNRIISGSIIAASVIAIVDTEASLHGTASGLLFALEATFALIFSLEYLACLYAAGELG